ncbi:MAG: hypothetical protein JST53_11825 [Actinobacteria bacterium]|nr:hypothetical protein [Actinomycetota bacterium]
MKVADTGAIEPDADGDGYGDLTEDGCPQSADFHTACPTVSFAPSDSVGARTIQVTVRAGATIAIPISDSILAELRRLNPRQALHLRLRAHATDVTGAPSSDHLIVRLPGRS